jgi:poly-beta-1,6-N-acetyl-D-glucosamine synthase
MSDIRPTYAIVTPAHDEAHFLPAVIASIAAQTIRPSQWIILNDRSKDHTAPLLDEAARQHNFIQVVHLGGDARRVSTVHQPAMCNDARGVGTAHQPAENSDNGMNGARHVLGSHVAAIVMKGVERVHPQTDYLVKMDADVVLPADYFARIFALFEADARLGIASGKMVTRHGKHWIEERCPDFHVPGPCKTYRAACFKQIGGLLPYYGWDILDCTKARMLGWTTRSVRQDGATIRHLRMMGSKSGMRRGQIGHGRAMWIINAHPLFVLGRAVYRAFEVPYLTGLLIVAGYLLARYRGEPQLDDRELVRYLRKEQLRRLLGKHYGDESIRVKTVSMP